MTTPTLPGLMGGLGPDTLLRLETPSGPPEWVISTFPDSPKR